MFTKKPDTGCLPEWYKSTNHPSETQIISHTSTNHFNIRLYIMDACGKLLVYILILVFIRMQSLNYKKQINVKNHIDIRLSKQK